MKIYRAFRRNIASGCHYLTTWEIGPPSPYDLLNMSATLMMMIEVEKLVAGDLFHVDYENGMSLWLRYQGTPKKHQQEWSSDFPVLTVVHYPSVTDGLLKQALAEEAKQAKERDNSKLALLLGG